MIVVTVDKAPNQKYTPVMSRIISTGFSKSMETGELGNPWSNFRKLKNNELWKRNLWKPIETIHLYSLESSWFLGFLGFRETWKPMETSGNFFSSYFCCHSVASNHSSCHRELST